MVERLDELLTLLILAVPVAAVTWTVTHEEILREFREYCQRGSRSARTIWRRKAFYVFTCEYCFSHWVALVALAVTQFTMIYSGWRGYVVAGFCLVWVANLYMTLFVRLRLEVKEERLEIAKAEAEQDPPPPAAVAGTPRRGGG